MSFEEAMQIAGRDERFMATVYAMNTLLIHKGIYTAAEFEQLFAEWIRKEEKKKSRNEQHASARFCEA
jgi:TPP-dependent indolepyruvate ferredoxin oxidoreductase alpha subunit